MSAGEYVAATPKSTSNEVRTSAISASVPNPFRTMADPASARARAMPKPIPLVEPVTRETFLARVGCCQNEQV